MDPTEWPRHTVGSSDEQPVCSTNSETSSGQSTPVSSGGSSPRLGPSHQTSDVGLQTDDQLTSERVHSHAATAPTFSPNRRSRALNLGPDRDRDSNRSSGGSLGGSSRVRISNGRASSLDEGKTIVGAAEPSSLPFRATSPSSRFTILHPKQSRTSEFSHWSFFPGGSLPLIRTRPSVPSEERTHHCPRPGRSSRQNVLRHLHHQEKDMRNQLTLEDCVIAEMIDRHHDMRLDVERMSYEELLVLEDRMGSVSTGLSEDTIQEGLKRHKHAGSDAEPTPDHCSICLEEYAEGDDIGTLDCGHEFHADCITKWLLIKNICPICRATALPTRGPST